jgi:hypothetical protein
MQAVLNLQTAKTLDLQMPPTLIGRADEVFESIGASSSHSLALQSRHGRAERARSGPTACAGSALLHNRDSTQDDGRIFWFM